MTIGPEAGEIQSAEEDYSAAERQPTYSDAWI